MSIEKKENNVVENIVALVYDIDSKTHKKYDAIHKVGWVFKKDIKKCFHNMKEEKEWIEV